MPYDKVIDSSLLDAGMTATANAIRKKTGGSSPIAWDSANGFKAAVEVISTGSGGGGVTLPVLTNPAAATDLALDKQLIDENGNMITGTLTESEVGSNIMATDAAFWGNSQDNTQFSISGIYAKNYIGSDTVHGFICRPGTNFVLRSVPTSLFGNATPEQVAKGATFTSAAGLLVEGTMEPGSGGSSVGGLTVKTGVTTSNVIDTGLSSIDYLIIQRYPVTTTGFTQGVYTAVDGFMTYTYCQGISQYVTVNVLSKESTSAVFTVSGGTFTWNGVDNKAFSGATYNWYAIGTV